MHDPVARLDPRDRRELWLFLLLALVVIGAGIGLRDPWPADEPRFVLVAKQMAERGNWLIPHRGGEIYADKPPAFMVLQALAYTLVGNWRIAFLLPSLLAALGTLALTWDLGRRLWNPRAGLYAAGALLLTFQFMYEAKRAQIDPTVTFLITLANWGLLRHFLLGPDWRAYWLGCFAAGLGVITKGVGVLALLLFVPCLYARWRRWDHLARIDGAAWRWLAGGLVFVVALALWLVPLLIAVAAHPGPEYAAYLHDILFRQTAERYAESWTHTQPWWYFGSVILTGWLPLALAFPGIFPAWRERLAARDARFLLPLAWVALVVVFFSLPAGKRDMYILPALPMTALCCGPLLGDIFARRWFRRLALGFVLLLGISFLAGGWLAWSGHLRAAQTLVEERGLGAGGAALWAFVVGIGAFCLACAAAFRVRRGVHALGIALLGIWLLWGLWACPVLNDSSSSAGLMRHVGRILGADGELGLVAWKEQNLLMADRPAADFGFSRPDSAQLSAAIRWQEAAPARRWIFILADAMTPCVDQAKAIYVGHANRREWWLFRADAVAPACRGGRVPADATSGAAGD